MGPGSGRAHILKLPLELREQILSYALHPFPRRLHMAPGPSWLQFFTGKPCHCPPLLLACRQLHAECLSLLYRDATVVINPRFESLVRLSRMPAREFVRGIDIALDAVMQFSHGIHQRVSVVFRPDKILDMIQRALTHLGTLALTICESVSYPAWGSNPSLAKVSLRNLILHPAWKEKITRLRLKMSGSVTESLAKYARTGRRDLLSRGLCSATALPNLAHLDLYLGTSMSIRSFNSSISVSEAPSPQRIELITTYLSKERTELQALMRILPDLFPHVQHLGIYRLFYRGRSETYERMEHDKDLQQEVMGISRRRAAS